MHEKPHKTLDSRTLLLLILPIPFNQSIKTIRLDCHKQKWHIDKKEIKSLILSSAQKAIAIQSYALSETSKEYDGANMHCLLPIEY
ncbi:hypothetical protein [Bartonella sp. OC41QHQL]|uniref:hypothetical protein n=1 Tax=Bartonella sp. OC41QHQL TaxID=3243564 RepID=UPI0035D04F4B